MPLVNTEGKVVFSNENRLMTVQNSGCQTLNYLMNGKTDLVTQYQKSHSAESIVMIRLDHLNFSHDYQYSLGLMSHKQQQILFASDSKNKSIFTILEINSLLALNARCPFVEFINNYQQMTMEFLVYNHYKNKLDKERLVLYQNSLENLNSQLSRPSFIKYQTNAFSLIQGESSTVSSSPSFVSIENNSEVQQVDQQSFNFNAINRFNRSFQAERAKGVKYSPAHHQVDSHLHSLFSRVSNKEDSSFITFDHGLLKESLS